MNFVESRDTSCKYESAVECIGKAHCSTCGWNPSVRKERVQQFLNERKNDLKTKPKYCPLQDYPSFNQRNSLGMVLRCHSAKCAKNADGLCETFAATMGFWRKIEAGIIGTATGKDET